VEEKAMTRTIEAAAMSRKTIETTVVMKIQAGR
jgi:hypothetical protein